MALHIQDNEPVAGNFAYDSNGNATSVLGKGTISYNYLNLPDQIVASGGTISYLYDAQGNKLKKTFNGTVSLYQGSVLLINGQPFVMTGEGRMVCDSLDAKWDYEYDLKDHLGNTRVSFLADNNKVCVLKIPIKYLLKFAIAFVVSITK